MEDGRNCKILKSLKFRLYNILDKTNNLDNNLNPDIVLIIN